jgi:hypothetical protein
MQLQRRSVRLTLRSPRLVPAAVVLLAPFVGVLVLRAPLLNNLAYRDPWFYSGYGWTLAHHVEIFGWFYYSVRFPVTLPIRWSTDVFGPVAGALILRYVILVATGAVLYLCVRRFASMTVACAAVVLLAINAFYVRMILWDYTSYIALPAAIAGVAIWLMASTRGHVFWSFLGSGALLGASFFSNAFSITFIGPLAVIELAAALRRDPRELGRLAVRTAAAALGGVLIFVAGYLGYRIYLGAFSAWDLIDPTLDVYRARDQYSAPFQRPAGEFLDGELRIYAPVVLCLGLVVVLGRRLLEDTLRARLAQYAVLYVIVLWIYRFGITSSVLETWWAYSMAAISMCFAVPVLLDELSRKVPPRLLATAAFAGAAIAAAVIRAHNTGAVGVYDDLRDHGPLVFVFLGAGAVLAAVLALVRSTPPVAAATALFFAFVAFLSLTPARYIGIQQTGEFATDGRTELEGYQAAYDMAKLVEDVDQPPSRVLLWMTAYGFPIVGWTNLPHQGGAIQNAEVPPATLGTVGPAEASLVHYPTTDGILLLSSDGADMQRGVEALRESGARPVVRKEGTWGDGNLFYAFVDTTPPS